MSGPEEEYLDSHGECAHEISRLSASLAAAESRAQAAEARAAMLERVLANVMQNGAANTPYSAMRATTGDEIRTALAASPSPLAQAIEGVLDWYRDDARDTDGPMRALRTAWRGAEPGETA